VVAVGGDGTVLQVATALSGTEVALAIVPTGTGNLLAGDLDIPHGLPEAVETAVAGQRRRIDVGRVIAGGKRRAFTVACGAGFDADVMDRTDSESKGRWGKSRTSRMPSARAATSGTSGTRSPSTASGARPKRRRS
jgi:diacylglycerol kinase family enzyme